MLEPHFMDKLEPWEWKYIDRMCMLVHLIIMRWVRDKRYKRGDEVPLKAAYARKIIGYREWPITKAISERLGLIIPGSYIEGQHSRLFRLGDEHAQSRWCQYPIVEPKAVKLIQKWRSCEHDEFWERARRHRRVSTFKTLMRHRDDLLLDQVDIAELCRQHEAELREEHEWKLKFGEVQGDFDMDLTVRQNQMVAQGIWDREWEQSICDYGRYHWNISRLWHHLRPYFKYKGEPLTNIEVKTSQMVFLCLLMIDQLGQRNQKQGDNQTGRASQDKDTRAGRDQGGQDEDGGQEGRKDQTAPLHTMCANLQTSNSIALATRNFAFLDADMRDFIYLVADPNQDLYTRLAELAGDDDSPRRIKKKNTFHLLYGSRFGRCVYRKALEQHFPSVTKFRADHERKHGYKKLSQQMQVHESNWMYDQVCRRLTREHPDIPLFPIHDSLMTTRQHVGEVKLVMTEELEKLGITPYLKEEDYSCAK